MFRISFARPALFIALLLGLSCITGCGEDKGNTPTEDKSSYQAPKDSMKKMYSGGVPGKAAQTTGKSGQ